MKALKKILTVLLVIAVILTAIFLAGRYVWKLGGFRACQGAEITSVEVNEQDVHTTGFYPGSFPEGFCGYHAKEQDSKLYVGFRFSAVFGLFETGNFDVTIPVKGEIHEVILKTSMGFSIRRVADGKQDTERSNPHPKGGMNTSKENLPGNTRERIRTSSRYDQPNGAGHMPRLQSDG